MSTETPVTEELNSAAQPTQEAPEAKPSPLAFPEGSVVLITFGHPTTQEPLGALFVTKEGLLDFVGASPSNVGDAALLLLQYVTSTWFNLLVNNPRTRELSRLIQEAISQNSPNNTQVGGNHYKMAIEPWDFIAANNIPYLEGSAITYLTRHREKGGKADLEKAIHFIQKIISHDYSGFGVQPTAQKESANVPPKAP